MKLSVIIVNYNVRYFLEQCLHSVQKACQDLEAEVFVVDNNSVDGSVKMVREKFPVVNLIVNKQNAGFSIANNQAIRLATGDYILLLNPDTIVEDDTLVKAVRFMEAHPEAGGLGVKMIDGKGKFLPESKRSLPSPSVAFYKVFGLSYLFPRSRIFSKYHLGYLDKDKIHPVEVLAGAFMMVRKKVLDEIGLLDESFFMYGEDIDLSYRITQAGYRNYYFPETRIIHYKGESTKKSSLNYVFLFYNAMIIFAKKHFSQKNARSFSMLIHLAIYLRAFISILTRFFSKISLPLADAAMIYTGLFFIKHYWEQTFIIPGGGHYPPVFIYLVVPLYILIWLGCVHLAGGYDRPLLLRKIIAGIIAGTLLILVIYSLLDEHYRFSRALIILGAVWGLIAMSGLRVLLHFTTIPSLRIGQGKNKRFVIVGEKVETERVAGVLQKAFVNPAFIGQVSYLTRNNSNGVIGHLDQIREIINIHKIDEVIFCAKDVPAHIIIDKMSEMKNLEIDFKIAPPESLSIIGSNSINTSGDLYVIDINAITKIANRRNKRLLDIAVSFSFLLFYPFILFFQKMPLGLLRNIFLVLVGSRSWVGFSPYLDPDVHLPEIRKGVLNPMFAFPSKENLKEEGASLNMIYARDYKLTIDLNIILKGFRDLGRK